jgi:glyoxylase-like metal-dependent hydrolase (beta-lactamase superfamily II)
VEVLKNVYQFRSETPFRYPLNTYFINDEKTCLIDVTAEVIPTNLITDLKKIGIQIEDIDYILVTHLHLEHIRSLGYFKKHAPNCQIVTGPQNAYYLENFEKIFAEVFLEGKNEFQNFPGVFEFYYDQWSPLKTIHVNKIIQDNEKLPLGGHTLTVLDTPGHAAEELTFYCEEHQLYFSSDFIVGEEVEPWVAINPIIYEYSGNRKEYYESLQKVALYKEKIQMILPAHGTIIHNAKEKIEWLLDVSMNAPEKVVKLLKSGPKTLDELTSLFFKKNIERSRKFYTISRMMRALLIFLIDEKRIIERESRYFTN